MPYYLLFPKHHNLHRLRTLILNISAVLIVLPKNSQICNGGWGTGVLVKNLN